MRGRAVVTVDFDTGIATAPGGRGYTYIREILDPPMPADQAPPKAPPTPLRPKNQGGRPRKYDWEQFYIWAAEIADKDSLPNRPKLMKQLYEK
ncbi:MAG: hypothetical protein JO058_15280, partial [Alphaproteobacteria bacterium]|nr:hypothetical protein [Alphaproteobacteria bacterium]